MVKLAKLITDVVEKFTGYIYHAFKGDRYQGAVKVYTVWIKDASDIVTEHEWWVLVVDDGGDDEAAYEYAKGYKEPSSSTFKSDLETAITSWLTTNTSYDKLLIMKLNPIEEIATLMAYKYNSTSKIEEAYDGMAFDDGSGITIRLFEKKDMSKSMTSP